MIKFIKILMWLCKRELDRVDNNTDAKSFNRRKYIELKFNRTADDI